MFKILIFALISECFFFITDTLSGSIAKKIPSPTLEILHQTVCPASTAEWCFWTSTPCVAQLYTTSFWSPSGWRSSPKSSTFGVIWEIRTSSPWSVWSTGSCFTHWPAVGTDSCAHGGGITGMGMFSSCIINVMGRSTSSMATAILPYLMTECESVSKHWVVIEHFEHITN